MRFRGLGAAISVLGIAAGLLASTAATQARVKVTIDLSTQRMHVTGSGGSYTWKVSSGRAGYNTPRGTYRPTVMRRMHYSRKYNNSPMPYSVFFRGGYAIHGTNYVSRLGAPASHGCIRLSKRNAATLYSMIKREGARITIIGSTAKLFAAQREQKRKIAKAKKARLKLAKAKRQKLRKLRQERSRLAKAIRHKNKKYHAKRYKKKRYAKKYRTRRDYWRSGRQRQNRAITFSRGRAAPVAYARQRERSSGTGIFDSRLWN